MLVVQGIVLYGAKALAALSPSSTTEAGDGKPQDQDVINALLQGLLLGLLAIPLLTKLIGNSLYQVFGTSEDATRKHSSKDEYRKPRAGLFYLLLVLVVFAAVPLWVSFVTGVRVNPVVWCLQYVVGKPIPRFVQLAFGIAFAAFLILEMVRVGPGDRHLAGYAGILSLGVLDTMASVIGFNFGSIRVSPNSKKTLEGTLAGIGALLLSMLLVIFMLPVAARPAEFRQAWGKELPGYGPDRDRKEMAFIPQTSRRYFGRKVSGYYPKRVLVPEGLLAGCLDKVDRQLAMKAAPGVVHFERMPYELQIV
ncbi:hypothetical protein R1flu_000351 [Riccia fluitans]|uniref:dolichol kinase n=1 Tax=Riccia fluitans TaxID=41844 RepID=A0ABD1Y0J7_9MARC